MKLLCFLLLSFSLVFQAPFALAAKYSGTTKKELVQFKQYDKHKNRDHNKKAKSIAEKTRPSHIQKRSDAAEQSKRHKKVALDHKQKHDKAHLRKQKKNDKALERRSSKNHRDRMLQAKRIRERFYSDRTHPKRYRESNRSLSDRSFRLSERKRLTLLRKNRLAASEKKHALASYYRKHRLQRIDPQSVKVSNVPFHASSKQWVEELAGKASWYGHDFHGGPTASGLRYDMYTFTAAHRTLPIGTIVKVTAQEDGKSVMVCVTDRGPYVAGRIIDLSYAAATQLGLRKKGVGDVNLEIVCDADGKPLKKQHAFYVQYTAAKGAAKAGPYKAFSDACTMQEALRQAHPDATVILSKTK